jgi:hypothetical protein
MNTNTYRHGLLKAAYRIDELVDTLCLGRNLIFDLLKSGDLKRVKIGKRTIVPAESVADFLDRKMAENHAARPTGMALTRKLDAQQKRREACAEAEGAV